MARIEPVLLKCVSNDGFKILQHNGTSPKIEATISDVRDGVRFEIDDTELDGVVHEAHAFTVMDDGSLVRWDRGEKGSTSPDIVRREEDYGYEVVERHLHFVILFIGVIRGEPSGSSAHVVKTPATVMVQARLGDD